MLSQSWCWGCQNHIFKGPHVRLVFDRQTTDFLLKNGPQNGPQNHWIWVSIFITFFATHLDPYFNDFVSQMVPKMVPKIWSFLRPPTLLKCRKEQQNLAFPCPGEGPFLRSLFETPPEHPFYRFSSIFGVHLGTLWSHFFDTFFDLIFRPPFEPNKKSDHSSPGWFF